MDGEKFFLTLSMFRSFILLRRTTGSVLHPVLMDRMFFTTAFVQPVPYPLNKKPDKSLIALPFNIQRPIAEFCGRDGNTLDIQVCQVQQQDFGTVDCGVFAIAFATHLVHGLNVSRTVFDTQLMRKHLIECLENNHMKVFPLCKGKRGKFCPAENLSLAIYCVCDGIYDPRDPMVGCEKCDRWFHARCVIK